MEGSIRERPAVAAPGIEPAGTRASPRWRWLLQFLRVLIGAALVATIIGGALAFYRTMVATKPLTPTRPSLERPRPVDSVVVTPAVVQPRLRLFGQIVAGRSVDLRVLVGGEVIEISPRLVEGGRVEAGETLVVVDPFEYEGALVRAKVELAEAEARIKETDARIRLERDGKRRADEQLEMAQRETQRLSTLQERGVASSAALDASKSRLAAAMAAAELRNNQIVVLEAQLAREQASLDRLRWNVRKAERDLTNTRLLAPFAGIVANVAAERGRLLNVSDRVATLTDLDRLEVRFTLTDAQFSRLGGVANGEAKSGGGSALIGREIEVSWGPPEAPLTAQGRIARVWPAIAAAMGGVDVVATMTGNGAMHSLRPGAFVTVTTSDVPYENVVRLPQSAAHPGNRVFIIGPDQRLSPITIEIIGFDHDLLLARGAFKPASRVLATRLPDAGPGLLVQPR